MRAAIVASLIDAAMRKEEAMIDGLRMNVCSYCDPFLSLGICTVHCATYRAIRLTDEHLRDLAEEATRLEAAGVSTG